jgi:hypothetical protein
MKWLTAAEPIEQAGPTKANTLLAVRITYSNTQHDDKS